MTCPYCSAEIEDKAPVCARCGRDPSYLNPSPIVYLSLTRKLPISRGRWSFLWAPGARRIGGTRVP